MRLPVYAYYLSLMLGCITSLAAHEQRCVGVFCSADDKIPATYKQEAYSLGTLLASRGYELVTGGSCTGLMNAVMDGYASATDDLSALYGVLPSVLKKFKIHHPALRDECTLWVDSLYERLTIFHRLCDAIIVLPGGFGTLHELLDFLVHAQFGLCTAHIILVSSNGYWDGFLAQCEHMENEHTLSHAHNGLIHCVPDVETGVAVLDTLMHPAEHPGLSTFYWTQSTQ